MTQSMTHAHKISDAFNKVVFELVHLKNSIPAIEKALDELARARVVVNAEIEKIKKEKKDAARKTADFYFAHFDGGFDDLPVGKSKPLTVPPGSNVPAFSGAIRCYFRKHYPAREVSVKAIEKNAVSVTFEIKA